MCGIAGHVGSRPPDDGRVELCLDLLHRRGPDHADFARFHDGARSATLLATRLDVIDLHDRANQPLSIGAKTIVYNGELYNYVELRRDLEREGYAFRTESDTEVMLATLDRFGWGALDRCEGMWAFAVHDAADGSVTLCRDRFGEKPLYLVRDGGEIVFASEPKAAFALLGRRLPVDEDHLRRFLVNGYKALYKRGETFFRGLEELPPASVLRLGRDGVERQDRYWAPRHAPRGDMTFEEAVAGTRERLVRSVELRLRADVPLAFCMSGGVDSSALISIARRACGYDVHGFTIYTHDARYDEREAVELSVRELGVRHTSVPLARTSFLPRLRELVRHHDAPVYTISYYAHWLLMEQIAHAGYRVSVSGTAADELFTGYYDHHLLYLREVEGAPEARAAREAWEREVRPHVRNPYLSDPRRFVDDPAFREHVYLDRDRFAAYLTRPFDEPFAEGAYTDDLLRNRMLNELLHEAVPVILHEDDANAMYWSVENRSPYLDRELCDFAYTIPSRHLVRDGRAKAVLREAVRGVAPDHVLDSPRKVGFNAPVLAVLDVDDDVVREELLAPSPIYDVVRRDRVAELLARRDLPNSESKFLFSFVSAKLFLEEAAA